MNAILAIKNKIQSRMNSDGNQPIEKPLDFDILLGRGKTSFNHVGNRRFRVFIGLHLRKYMDADSRMAKTLVVNAVVEAIQEAGGRFLKQDSKSKKWMQVSPKMAREKVGHALRDAVGMRLKMIQAGEKPPDVSPEVDAMLVRGTVPRRGSASEMAIARARRASNIDVPARPSLDSSTGKRFSRSCNDLMSNGSSSLMKDASRAILELAESSEESVPIGSSELLRNSLMEGSSELLFGTPKVASTNNDGKSRGGGLGSKKLSKKKISRKETTPQNGAGTYTGETSAEFSIASEATAKKWGFDNGSTDFSVATVDSKVFEIDTEANPLSQHLMDEVSRALTDLEVSGELMNSKKKGGSGLFRRKNSSKKLGKEKGAKASTSMDADLSEDFSIMSMETTNTRSKVDDLDIRSEEFGLKSEEFVTGLKSEDFALKSDEFEFDGEMSSSRSNSLVSAMRNSSLEFGLRETDFEKIRANAASDMDKLRNSAVNLDMKNNDFSRGSSENRRNSKITWSDDVHKGLMDTVIEGSALDELLPDNRQPKNDTNPKGDKAGDDELALGDIGISQDFSIPSVEQDWSNEESDSLAI